MKSYESRSRYFRWALRSFRLRRQAVIYIRAMINSNAPSAPKLIPTTCAVSSFDGGWDEEEILAEGTATEVAVLAAAAGAAGADVEEVGDAEVLPT